MCGMVLVYLVPTLYDMALGLVSFALPLFLLDSQVDPVTMGSLLALPSVVQILTRIPAGLLSGRIGNLYGMLMGCVFTLASGALVGAAPAAALVSCVAAAQVLSGLGRACFWPANQAFVLDTARGSAASAIGAYNFIVTLGGMAGPLIAGWVIVRAGYRWPFWLMALLAVVCAALLVTRGRSEGRAGVPAAAAGTAEDPEAGQAAPARGWGALSQVGVVVRSPGVWLAGLTCLVSVIPFAVTTSFLPVLLKTRGLSAGSISLLVTVRSACLALFSLLTGPFVPAPRRTALLGAATLSGSAALFMIPAVAGGPLTALPMMLFGLCGAGMHNVQMAAAGEAVPRQNRALAMALVGSIGGVAMVLIPIVFGWMTSHGWLEKAFPATGAALGLVGAAAWRWCAVLQRRARGAGRPSEVRTPQITG
jgi:MFS family permease